MEFFQGSDFVMFFQIFLAMVFGMVLGLERVIAGRTAGPRTYGLVSLGACLLTIISVKAGLIYPIASKADPAAIVAAIITGIGFLGAGLIIFHGSRVSGLTTAAGIWVAAAIGIAAGFKLYLLAFFATSLTLFIFTAMWRFENAIKTKFVPHADQEDSEHEEKRL